MSMEEGLDVFNDVLEHHGILGQKWGVKNGPPYPLDGSVPTEQKTRMSSLMKSEIQRLFKDENEGSSVNPSKFDESKIRYDSIKPSDSHYLNVRHSIINQGRVSKEVLDDKNSNKSTYYLVNKERKDTRPGFISVIDTKDGTTYLATYAQEGLINQDSANKINESIKNSIRINSQKLDHSDMSVEEGLDLFNDCLEHSGKWTWPNGNNSPEYNKWYYETVTKVKNGAQDLADAAADKWNNRGNEVKYIDEDTVMMPDGTYRSREWYEAHKDDDPNEKKEVSSDPFPNVKNGGSDNNWHEDDKGIYRTNDDEWRHQQARKKYADKEKKKRNKNKQAKNVNNLMYAVDRYVTHSDMSVEEGVDLFNDYLEHHGIMGMKWGVKNGPPYPLGADDHNASERRANWEQSLKKAGSALKKGAEGTGAFIKKTAQNTSAEIHRRNEASKAAKAEKIENKRRAEEEQRNQDRRTAINTANAQYAEDNFADMSEAEINELLRRVDLKARVDKASGANVKESKKTFADTVDNIAYTANRVGGWVNTGINTYNTVARVYNSFSDNKMPVIDGDYAARKKKEKEEELNKLYKGWLKSPEYWNDPEYQQLFTNQQIKDLADRKKNLDRIAGNDSNPSPEETLKFFKGKGADIPDDIASDFIDEYATGKKGGKGKKNNSSNQQPQPQPQLQPTQQAPQQSAPEPVSTPEPAQSSTPSRNEEYYNALRDYGNYIDEQNRRREEYQNSLPRNRMNEDDYWQTINNYGEELRREQARKEEKEAYDYLYSKQHARHSAIELFNDALELVEV